MGGDSHGLHSVAVQEWQEHYNMDHCRLVLKTGTFYTMLKAPFSPGLSKKVYATHLQATWGHKVGYLRLDGGYSLL